MISSTCYQNISKLGFVFISFLLGNFFPDCLFLRGMILSVVGKIMLGCGVVWPYRDTDWPEIWESPLVPSCPSCHPTFIVIAHQLVLTLDVPSICTLLSIPFVLCLVTQSCLTLCDPMDYSLPGSSTPDLCSDLLLLVLCNSFLTPAWFFSDSFSFLHHCPT